MPRILEKIDHTSGCGGFLNPPTHPEHTKSVVTDLNRRPQNRGFCNLSYAIGCEWVNPAVRKQAAQILADWQPLPIDSEPVVTWRRKVLGYFRSCYVRPYSSRNVSDLLIDSKRNPLAFAHQHAGVQFIRTFYPAYHPSKADFTLAKWGD